MSSPSPAAEEAARPATVADLPAVVGLAAALRAGASEQRGGALWLAHDAHPAPTVDGLTATLADPDALVLVGTLDDHVLAYALAHTELLDDGRRLGVVDELLVDEPARAVGLGEALLAELERWARSAGCLGLDATALPGDRTAKNFFEAAGFTARRLVMHRPLA